MKDSDSDTEMDSTARSSGAHDARLSNDTDSPFIPVYSEDRTTFYGLFTLYSHNFAITSESTALQACSYPLRITQHPAQQAKTQWVGDTNLAVSTILESLPRVVTTPGDLSDTQIRTQIQTYFEGIIDLIALYMPVAAMRGYGQAYPLVSGYVDNYLSSVGAKPWQVRQMQTLWRSLAVPPSLVKYCMDYYAVKQHPRVANLHHYMPISAYNSTEAPGASSEIYKWFTTRFNTMRNSVTDYDEFLALLKLGGYPLVDMPDTIPVSTDAKSYELQVGSAPYFENQINANNTLHALPAAGYKDRLINVCRYVHDLGPSFFRGLSPVYVSSSSSNWDSNAKVFNSNSGNTIIESMGFHHLPGYTNGVRKVRPGILLMTGTTDVPFQAPTPGSALSTGVSEAIGKAVSDNISITTMGANNPTQWNNTVLGYLTADGEAQMYFSDTIDPNVLDASAGTTNTSNAKQVYDALLKPA